MFSAFLQTFQGTSFQKNAQVHVLQQSLTRDVTVQQAKHLPNCSSNNCSRRSTRRFLRHFKHFFSRWTLITRKVFSRRVPKRCAEEDSQDNDALDKIQQLNQQVEGCAAWHEQQRTKYKLPFTLKCMERLVLKQGSEPVAPSTQQQRSQALP